MALKEEIKSATKALLPKVVEVRRHIHAHPELSFQEEKTQLYVEKNLRENGIENIQKISNTGLVVLINSEKSSIKTIALRADLDALPIVETNEVSYKSQNNGVMHACGHDAHSASMIGVCLILHQIRRKLNGCVKIIFQPGEEKLPGGASIMIKDGVLQNPAPNRMFAQHVFPDLEAGKVGFRSGLYMASTDEIYLTVNGKGGHAALPHLLINPITIASQIILELQEVANKNPVVPTVLSIGKVTANGATNVVPDKVFMEGTLRTFDEKWRAEAHQIIKEICTRISASYGATCDVNIAKGYPFLVNDEAATAFAKERAIEYLGKENVIDLDLRMTAEDFAYFSQLIPSCFYRFGTGFSSEKNPRRLHTSTFDIDESSLETSVGLMAWIAASELS